MATADHFESRSEDEDEYDLGEMETEAEEERDIFEMPLMSSVVGRAQLQQRPGLLHLIYVQQEGNGSIYLRRQGQ